MSYEIDFQTDTLKATVRELLYYLDIIEETDDGKPFRPNYISSCRALDAEKLKKVISELRELVK